MTREKPDYALTPLRPYALTPLRPYALTPLRPFPNSTASLPYDSTLSGNAPDKSGTDYGPKQNEILTMNVNFSEKEQEN